jgi:hypothetical protein
MKHNTMVELDVGIINHLFLTTEKNAKLYQYKITRSSHYLTIFSCCITDWYFHLPNMNYNEVLLISYFYFTPLTLILKILDFKIMFLLRCTL